MKKNKSIVYISDEFMNLKYIQHVVNQFTDEHTNKKGKRDYRKFQTMYNILSFLSLEAYNVFNQHREFDELITISQDHLLRLTGTKTLTDTHHAYSLFNNLFVLKEEASYFEEYANGYDIVEDFKEDYYRYIDRYINAEDHLYRIYTANGSYTLTKQLHNVINTNNCDMTTQCKINIAPNISHLDDHQLYTVQNIMKYCDTNGYVTIPYQLEKAGGGRLYSYGLTNFQVKKELRNVLLYGMYDYDIDNCAIVLLYQYYLMNGGERLVNIEYYIENKSYVRESLTFLEDPECKIIKSAFLSLFFGSNLKSHENGLMKTLKVYYGHEPKEYLLDDDFAGIRFIKNQIINQSLFVDIADDFEKVKDMFRDEKGVFKRKEMAKKFRQLESMIMGHIIDYCDSNDNPVNLIIHDGFVLENSINTKDLESYILTQTGYNISISEDKFLPDLEEVVA